MIAPKAPADDLADVSVRTSALAIGGCPLRFIKRQLRQSAIVRHGFEHPGFLLGGMVGARTKLNRTIAVIMPFHEQTTYALAVVAALPIVSSDFAKVSMHWHSIFLRE